MSNTIPPLYARRIIAVLFCSSMLCGAMAASQIPSTGDVVEAGRVVGDMDAAHLLGTITICSMILAAFLGYLLYRSQKDQWTMISEIKTDLHKVSEKEK